MGWLPAGRFADLRIMQIVRLLFICLAFLFTLQAHAEDIPSTVFYNVGILGQNKSFLDLPAACQFWADTYAQPRGELPVTVTFCELTAPNAASTYIKYRANNGTEHGQFSGPTKHWYCPNGGTLNEATKMCIGAPPCPAGQVRQPNGSCGANCEPGCTGACGGSFTFKRLRTLVCINSCIHKAGPGIEIKLADGTSSASHYNIGPKTGDSCEGVVDPGGETAVPPSPSPDPSPCPECDCKNQGKSWGTVNGAVVCVKPGTPGSPEVKKVDAPTVTTTTPAPTPENPNPSPVVTETPSPIVTITPPPVGSPDGTPPTVTETQNNPDGSSTSTNQSKDSYCTANPNSPMCKNEDATRFCEENPDVLACQKLGEAPDLIPLEVKEVNIGQMILRELPADNSCPAPLTTTIYGHTISLSFEPLCQYASTFKPLVLSLAWLSAAFIVVGYRKDS